MKYINYFTQSYISYYVYKLDKGDSIIYSNHYYNQKNFIILSGLVYFSKVFINKQNISLGILSTNNIIKIPHIYFEKKYYYKILAIKKTYIISFENKYLYQTHVFNKKLLLNILYSYELTLSKYFNMNNILANKYIKYRLLQLIFFMSKEFGIIQKQKIIIPFIISKYEIGIIIGSNKNTINQILKEFKPYIIMEYKSKHEMHIKDPFHLIHNYCY